MHPLEQVDTTPQLVDDLDGQNNNIDDIGQLMQFFHSAILMVHNSPVHFIQCSQVKRLHTHLYEESSNMYLLDGCRQAQTTLVDLMQRSSSPEYDL